MKLALRFLPLLLITVFIVAIACGDDEEDAPAAAPPAAAPPAAAPPAAAPPAGSAGKGLMNRLTSVAIRRINSPAGFKPHSSHGPAF